MNIKLTQEQKKEIDELFEEAEAFQSTIQELSKKAHKRKQMVWEKIHQWYPESGQKDINYNNDLGELYISEPTTD